VGCVANETGLFFHSCAIRERRNALKRTGLFFSGGRGETLSRNRNGPGEGHFFFSAHRDTDTNKNSSSHMATSLDSPSVWAPESLEIPESLACLLRQHQCLGDCNVFASRPRDDFRRGAQLIPGLCRCTPLEVVCALLRLPPTTPLEVLTIAGWKRANPEACVGSFPTAHVQEYFVRVGSEVPLCLLTEEMKREGGLEVARVPVVRRDTFCPMYPIPGIPTMTLCVGFFTRDYKRYHEFYLTINCSDTGATLAWLITRVTCVPSDWQILMCTEGGDMPGLPCTLNKREPLDFQGLRDGARVEMLVDVSVARCV